MDQYVNRIGQNLGRGMCEKSSQIAFLIIIWRGLSVVFPQNLRGLSFINI
jgi:hypothetical protein